jgi:benzoylformate decarboxylase
MTALPQQAEQRTSHDILPETLRGRDCVLAYLKAAGITHLFGVPGTNEIPIIDGTLNPAYEMAYVSCLHENIAMGAAMGYARSSGKPGALLVHVTPGAGHGLGNLFNAHKSHIPLVVLCGQQHDQLLLQEPLLASDVVQVAQQYTKWAYEVRTPHELPIVMQRALKLAITPPCGPVFLAFPWEFLVQEVHYPVQRAITHIGPRMPGDQEALAKAARLLAQAKNPIIVVGDGVGASDAWEEMKDLAQTIGAPVYAEQLSSVLNYPNSDYHWQGELPPFQEDVQKTFDDCDVAFLCGFNAQAQLVIFNYEKGALISNKYCRQWTDCKDESKRLKQVYLHNDAWEIGKNYYGDAGILADIKTSLPILCEQIVEQQNCEQKTQVIERNRQLRRKQEKRSGEFREYIQAIAELARQLSSQRNVSNIDSALVATTLGLMLKEQKTPFTYVNEAISDTGYFLEALPFASPDSYLSVEGGSLGYSMAMSVGVSLALRHKHEHHLIINAVGDGSALFYPNLWWTVAKYNLPILYIIMNNRKYATLLKGLQELENLYPNAGIEDKNPGYLYLEHPAINFVRVAQVFGLADEKGEPCGQVVTSFDDLVPALQKALDVVLKEQRAYVLDIHTAPLRESLPASSPVQQTVVF